MITLEATKRDLKADLTKLRKEGKIPAVFYGPGTRAEHSTGQANAESTPITLVHKEFVKAWHKAGESGVITIKTPTESVDALIKDVNLDPVTDIPRHADFYVFEKGKKIEVDVPLEFVGVSPVVKDLGGSLVKALHEIKISADPQHIPHHIEVDISALLDFDSKILAGDLKMPTGVDLIELPTEVVAAAAKPKEEEVEDTTPVDLSTIEVEKKGKKEEEGEVGAEEAVK